MDSSDNNEKSEEKRIEQDVSESDMSEEDIVEIVEPLDDLEYTEKGTPIEEDMFDDSAYYGKPYENVHRFLYSYQSKTEKERWFESEIKRKEENDKYNSTLVPSPAFIGLPNTGNSCYLNSVIQFFLQSEDLQVLLRYLFCPQLEITFGQLQEMLIDIKHQYTRSVGIELHEQCDSSLFLGWIVDQIKEKAIKQSNLKMLQFIREDFEIQQLKVRRCLKCNHRVEKETNELFLSLYASSNATKIVQLVDLYNDQYIQQVELKCEKCGHNQSKELAYNKENPYHLFVVINALHARVNIPDILCVPHHNHNTEEYILQGIIIHRGISEHFGHYVAYTCANDANAEPDEDVWTEYNDTTVRNNVNVEHILSGDVGPYTSVKVLWYVKANPDSYEQDVVSEPLKGG